MQLFDNGHKTMTLEQLIGHLWAIAEANPEAKNGPVYIWSGDRDEALCLTSVWGLTPQDQTPRRGFVESPHFEWVDEHCTLLG